MPNTTYHGHKLNVDQAYSYARVSTAAQNVHGAKTAYSGEGIGRQTELSRLWSLETGIPIDAEYTAVASGSKGHHLKKGTALDTFLTDLKAIPSKIKPNSALLVENFSRLSRLPIDDALLLFLDIIRNGVTLVTLQDRSVYTRQSIRGNAGDMHKVTALLQAAATEAEAKGYFSRGVYAKRRTRATGNKPAWIVPDAHPEADKNVSPINGLTLHKAKAAILRKLFKLALSIGADMIAKQFNNEQVPTLNNRKTRRGFAVWDKATICNILRGKQAIGLQEIGKYVDGKRILTGETVQAYPAAVDKDLWLQVNGAMDGRKRGAHTGRNVASGYTNLYGELGRCGVCGGRLNVRSDTKIANKWLACSNAGTGSNRCSHRTYYRIGHVDRDVFALFRGLTWESKTPDNKAAGINLQIDTITKRMAKRQKSLDGMAESFVDAPASIRRSMAKLARDQDQDEATRARLERQLAVLKQAKPSDAELAAVQGLTMRLQRLQGAELAEARAKISAALPSLMRALVCGPDGKVSVTLSTGVQVDLGNVSGYAVKDGFHIGPSVIRPSQPIPRLAADQPDIAAFVPFRHPLGANQARYKAAGKSLQTFKASESGKGAKKARKAF